MGFAIGSVVGFCEELGWTGFVIPKLRLRFDSFWTAAMVGVLWGAWHVPVNILSCLTASGGALRSEFFGHTPV